jgi:hypothetical protein
MVKIWLISGSGNGLGWEIAEAASNWNAPLMRVVGPPVLL